VQQILAVTAPFQITYCVVLFVPVDVVDYIVITKQESGRNQCMHGESLALTVKVQVDYLITTVDGLLANYFFFCLTESLDASAKQIALHERQRLDPANVANLIPTFEPFYVFPNFLHCLSPCFSF
jgi:hypothetical protein